MPGRAYIGLSLQDENSSEFQTSRLPDEPQVTAWLVVGAVVAALAVVLVGAMIHWPATRHHGLHHGLCNGPPLSHTGEPCLPPHLNRANRIPMAVWFALAGLAATLVICTPFL